MSQSGDIVTQVGTNSDGVLNLFLSLHLIGGHVLLPILVIIFIFRTTRHPTLINLCLAAIITSICACLLLYTNTHRGPEPPFGLCLTQASLASGVQPVLVMTTQALVYQIWSSVYCSKSDQHNLRWQSIKSVLLLSVPWITFGAYVTSSAVIGFQNPTAISRNRRFFYCSLQANTFTNWISIFCATNLLIIMIMQIWIGYNIFRNWRAVRSGESKDVNLSMVVRVICFVVSILVGLVLSLLAIEKAPQSPIPDLWLASISVFIVLIFGTQREVWNALKDAWPSREKWQTLKIWPRKKRSYIDLIA